MTYAITAAQYGDTPTQPCVLLTATGLTAGQTVDITVQEPASDERKVRGAVGAIAQSDAMVIVDTVPALGRLLTYTLYINGTYEASTTVTVTYTGHHILTDVATGQGIEVQVVDDDDTRTYSARSTSLQPVGSAYPVVLFDTRASATGTLNVVTPDRATSLALQALLAPGRPIASRHRNDSCDIAGLEFLYPQDVAATRFLRNGSRTFALPFIAIDVPDPTLVTSVVTLQDLANAYTGKTLADVAADYVGKTLLDLAQSDFGAI